MRKPKAYFVSMSDLVVIADDSRDIGDIVAEAIRDGITSQRMTVDELARWGNTYPIGSWDPDRELTCAEIAAEMRARGDE